MSTIVTSAGRKRTIGNGVRSALILLFALIYLIPLYIAVSNAFKSYWDVIKSPLALLSEPTMDNFVEAFHSSNILSLYGTSILITFSSVALLILICSTAAYIIIRRKNKLCKFLYGFALIGIMVPPVVTLVPSIKTLSMLGLMYTPWGLVMFYGGAYFSTTIFLYTGFINSIPVTLDESAYIDGANTITIFFRIIFPLLKPCTATAIILMGMWIWNDFLNPMYILGSTAGKTITLGIYNSIGALTSKWNLVFANVILASFPIVVLYLCMQKQFMSGLTAGAVKG
ncbi:MAG: carbohydrate ABC transporter permease [Clostridia bacterium]|nr:carbohydrate ABC transporter permease [Clostridia bacterium]